MKLSVDKAGKFPACHKDPSKWASMQFHLNTSNFNNINTGFGEFLETKPTSLNGSYEESISGIFCRPVQQASKFAHAPHYNSFIHSQDISPNAYSIYHIGNDFLNIFYNTRPEYSLQNAILLKMKVRFKTLD